MENNELLTTWERNLSLSGIKPEVAKIYTTYIEKLISNDVPIIFDFEHLCLLLGRSTEYLASAINASSSHYRTFSLQKRKGGERKINVPYPALLECQYWVYENILKKVKIHGAAHGFAFKKSIITGARLHVDRKEFLKIDIKDFFPSIKINRIIPIFRALGYSKKVAYYLSAICTIDGYLPQGAPTSPVLSNLVLRHMDKRLLSFAKKMNLRYTRYADDLAFSGEQIPFKFLSYIEKIIESSGFLINEGKTFFQKSAGKRILTGISIADSELKLPREYKRKLKQEVFFVKQFGLLSHMRKKKIRNGNYLQSLIGKIRFWLQVEPKNIEAKEHLDYLVTLEPLRHTF